MHRTVPRGRARLSLPVVAAVMVAACSSGAPASLPVPASLAPTTPPASTSPSASQTSSAGATVVLTGSVLHDRTTGNDVHSIYLLEDGVDTPLTQPGAFFLGPVAPDRKRMLVMPGGDIPPPITGGTLDLDGTNFRRLPLTDATLNLVPAAWSPDGQRIAFAGWDDDDPARTGIYSAQASDGTALIRVTERPGLLADAPLQYSPDGNWLLFYRAAHPDPDPHIGGSLWVVRIDGSDAREVSGTAKPADWARWSPDGSKILFATERTSPEGGLWTVSPDGSSLAQLPVDLHGDFAVSPTWSPDGSQILFALSTDHDEFRHADNVLAVVNADGTDLRVVAGPTGFNRWPEWLP